MLLSRQQTSVECTPKRMQKETWCIEKIRNYYSGGNYISVFYKKYPSEKSPIGTKNKKSHFFIFLFYKTFSQNNFDRKNRNLISAGIIIPLIIMTLFIVARFARTRDGTTMHRLPSAEGGHRRYFYTRSSVLYSLFFLDRIYFIIFKYNCS